MTAIQTDTLGVSIADDTAMSAKETTEGETNEDKTPIIRVLRDHDAVNGRVVRPAGKDRL